MDKSILLDLLEHKIKRQVKLDELKKQLEEVDLDLTGSRIGRWFGSTYLLIKTIICLLLGAFFVLMAFLMILFPDAFIEVVAPEHSSNDLEVLGVHNYIFEDIIRISSGLSLIVGIVLLYIARLSSKMRKRNKQITEAQVLSQDIIIEFKKCIEESAEEIESIQNIIRPSESS